MQLLLVILGLLFGLVLLVRGADEMVKSAVRIAQKYRIPQSVVGAVYVGFGTSAPEWVSSTIAVLQGDLSLAMGNIIGSNIANSLLVLSILFLLLGQHLNKKMNLKPVASSWMIGITLLFISGYFITNSFSRLLGIALLTSMVFAIRALISEESDLDETTINIAYTKNLPIRSLLSVVATIFGSKLVVDNAIELANIFNISSLVVGVVVVAFGTSLPEIVSTISAAKMDKPGIVFGNIFGSNLFNIGLVGGTSIIIAPGRIEFDIRYQLLTMLIASIFVVIISKQKIRKNTGIGLGLLILYFLFIFSLF
jgi:cation:H+ antiporter